MIEPKWAIWIPHLRRHFSFAGTPFLLSKEAADRFVVLSPGSGFKAVPWNDRARAIEAGEVSL